MTGHHDTAPALVVHAHSATWRRRLGPLAWAALEELALSARPTEHGWAAPVGVRDVAAGVGVSKDTAARAITTLRTAGLVTRTQVESRNGGRRSGYRLQLPEGLTLQSRPTNHDSSLTDRPAGCPPGQDKPRPRREDSDVTVTPVETLHPPERASLARTTGVARSPVSHPGKRVAPQPTLALQPTLFALSRPPEDEAS